MHRYQYVYWYRRYQIGIGYGLNGQYHNWYYTWRHLIALAIGMDFYGGTYHHELCSAILVISTVEWVREPQKKIHWSHMWWLWLCIVMIQCA